MKTKVWKEEVVIPTYKIGAPEKYPIFLEKRVYQGSSGAVYPFPIIEKIYDEKEDKEWIALFLENDFIKVMILPELGGRIQIAYDKIKERHFIYYNQVIKPALVGLNGPWISGGIEFNWPQHHRPSTFEPVDFNFKENSDGSATIRVSEIERMSRTRGTAAFTLYSGKAYLEMSVQLYNRTPFPQNFLWWANPAVKVNEHYQSVFPPDVRAVYDHGKRDVSTFPIATGTYYKVDYSSGVDISWYKNIPVPTSFMAVNSKYDFLGGYEHDTKGGVLHVANHHVSPGKKQWTWGNGDFGHVWDRNLTDEDGPYIELMCGVYTDNQPDFSWLHPYEEKSFKQYFLPYRELGLVKNANKDALLNLEFNLDQAEIKVMTTGTFSDCTVLLTASDKVFLQDKVNFKPGMVYEKSVLIDKKKSEINYKLTVFLSDGSILLSWQPELIKEEEIPAPALPAQQPEEIDTIERLYLNGLHLEQYRHATFSPLPYYEEALRRDPDDIRNNNALGLWLLRRGKYPEAEKYFKRAINRLTLRNPNPYDCEPYFNLGLTLKQQNRLDEAYDAFYKSVWDVSWQDAGYFNLALIDTARNNYNEALDLVERSLIRNQHNHKAHHLKSCLLRKFAQPENALKFLYDSLQIDPFNFGVLFEIFLITKTNKDREHLQSLVRDNPHNYIEISLDYANAGLWDEAYTLISIYTQESKKPYPITLYCQGWYAYQLDNNEQALRAFELAAKQPPDFCFPNRIEEVTALKKAIEINTTDVNAFYFLGNFFYANKCYDDAINYWESGQMVKFGHAGIARNLALAYFNKLDKHEEALKQMELAFAQDSTDARLLMELDQLYIKLNRPYKQRLQFLEMHMPLINHRDDLYLERVSLYNFLGKYKKALQLIKAHTFHPWEGGEGRVTGQYVLSYVQLGKHALFNNDFEKAITYFEAAQTYPENLGEGKLSGTMENDIFYWMGYAYAALDNNKEATALWTKASEGISEPSPVLYYNDQQPDKIFYQGLALRKLGEEKEAKFRFQKLLDYGKKHASDNIKIDYFAVSLPDLLIWEDDLNKCNELFCKYLIGLGQFGLGDIKQARSSFELVLENNRYHAGAFIHLKLLKKQAAEYESTHSL